MRTNRLWALRAASLAGLCAGCASVDPSPDIQRAGELAGRAAGAADVFDPSHRAAASEIARELLSDGITAEEAARIALLNNAELNAALFDIGLASADLVQAGLLSNPSLGVAFRFPSAGGLANVDFDLAQNIAELWQIPPRKRSAARRLEQVILRVAHQAAETAGQAREAYFHAAALERRHEYAVQGEEIGRTVLDLAEARQAAGAGGALDVNLARGASLEAELNRMNASLALRTAKRELANILGLECDAESLRLTDELPEPRHIQLDDSALLAFARSERLDMRALTESVREAEAEFVLQARRVFPNLAVGLAFEREARGRADGRDLLADTARASFDAGQLTAPLIAPRPDEATDESFVIGPSFSLDLPIFDQNQAQIAKARYAVEQRRAVLEGRERALVQEIREAADQARTAWKLAAFHRDELLVQAEANLLMARESYQAGKTGILSVLDAQRAYLASRERYAWALETAATATPRLERVVGLPMERVLDQTKPSSEPLKESSDGECGERIGEQE